MQFELNLYDQLFWLSFILWLSIVYIFVKGTNDIKNLKSIIFLRVFILGLIVFLFLEPKLFLSKSYKYDLNWNLYVDKSLSMSYHTNPSVGSLLSGLDEILIKLKNKKVGVKTYGFGSSLDTNWINNGRVLGDGSTNIGDVFDHIKSNSNKKNSGSIIITDGQVNLGKEITTIQTEELSPIHILGVGNKNPLVDVSIQSIEAPPVIIKGENAELEVIVSSSGEINQKLNTTLFFGKKLLGSKIITLSGKGIQENVRFMISPDHLGEMKYKVHVNALPDEINIDNNKQNFTIQVLKDKYKIAIITGAPNFNTQILKKVLKKNSKFSFDHFVLQSQEYTIPLKKFWDTKYDLIIFDNHPVEANSNEWKSYLRVFAKKILSQKTSLAIIPGYDIKKEVFNSYLNLMDIKVEEPIIELQSESMWSFTSEWESFFPFISSEIDKQLFDYPPLFSNLNIDPTNGNVLAKFSLPDMEVPLLLISEKAPLRFMVWSSPDLNQLYYKTQNTEHEDFTIKILKPVFSWLTRTSNEKDFYFRPNKNSYQQGEQVSIIGKPVQKNMTAFDGYIHVYNNDSLINNKKLSYNKEKGVYTGNFWASEPGNLDYDIEFISDENSMIVSKGSVQIQESQVELNKIYLNKLPLKKLAESTNGTFTHWEERLNLLKLINKEIDEEIIQSSVVLNKSKIIIIFILCLLALEWLIRRERGML